MKYIKSTTYPDVQLTYNQWARYIHTGKLPRRSTYTIGQYHELIRNASHADDIIHLAECIENDSDVIGVAAYMVLTDMLNYQAKRV